MARDSYPPRYQIQQSFTRPPKAQDIRFYSEYDDPIDDFNWNPEKIFFSFTFFTKEEQERSPAYEYLIEIENLETGVVKNFVQLHDKPYYRFWQRQAEVYTESPVGDEIDLTEEAIVNSRITVTPVNDFGDGEKSIFLLPFKDMVWTRSKDNTAQETFAILNSNWNLFSEDPENRVNRPKIMYIYLDVPESDIELDRELLNTDPWFFDSLTDFKTINTRTFRWSVSDTSYRRLSKDGWKDADQEEQEFIIDLVQTMLPAYRDHVTTYGLTVSDPTMFKLAVENPRDSKDSVIIYLMKETRWRP